MGTRLVTDGPGFSSGDLQVLCSPSISIHILTNVLQFTYKICYREVGDDEKVAQTRHLGHR